MAGDFVLIGGESGGLCWGIGWVEGWRVIFVLLGDESGGLCDGALKDIIRKSKYSESVHVLLH